MLTSNTIYYPQTRQMLTHLEEIEGVPVRAATRRDDARRESGAQIWAWQLNGMSLIEIAWALQGQYEMTPEEAVTEVLVFLIERHGSTLAQESRG